MYDINDWLHALYTVNDPQTYNVLVDIDCHDNWRHWTTSNVTVNDLKRQVQDLAI